MTFLNNIVDKEQLPSIEKIQYMPLDRTYLNVMRIVTLIISLFLIAGFSILKFFEAEFELYEYLIIISVIILLSILRFIFCNLSFKAKGYALREKDIIYKKGVIWGSITTIPFNRIQHTEIKEGAISRLFSLQSVKFYTAGGSASDLSINGLSKEDAQKIKEFVNGNIKEYAN